MDPQTPDEKTLSAWLDGELDPPTQARVDAWLQDHPEQAARVRLWAADRDALRARFDPVLSEDVPEAMRKLVRDARLEPESARGGWRRWALAAGWMAVGALIGGSLVWQLQPLPEARMAGRSAWTHRAAVAHAVYAPEVRHPVEVNVAEGSAAEQQAQEQHLARWLTKRLDMPVKLFDLRDSGFELVGGRLLPNAAGPSAQLMYQNGAGQRVTVYLRRPEPGASTAFRYQRDGELGMFFWVEDGYGCALVGNLPRERLLALAESVYRQSEAEIKPPPAPPRPPS
jgi:anti-sigma factor RsiW